MYENLTPFENRILVKKYDKEDTTESGIILLESDANEVRKGIILAIGLGISVYDGQPSPMPLKLGDVVYYPKDSGIELDNVCTILRRDEIIGSK